MRRVFSVGGHIQVVEIENNKLVSATCDCAWDTFEDARWDDKRKSWPEKILCKHLKEAIKMLFDKVN